MSVSIFLDCLPRGGRILPRRIPMHAASACVGEQEKHNRIDGQGRLEPAWARLPSLSQNWRFGLDEQLNSGFGAALLEFNREAVVYCKGISDTVAQEYAMEYARMLQNRAKGIEGQIPRIPAGLFEPNRNLIRLTLDRMWKKYFRHG